MTPEHTAPTVTLPQPAPLAAGTAPALLRMIHRVRVGGSVMGFAILASHLHGQGYGALGWLLLALQFFVYPHLIHWRARRAPDPFRAALHNFLLDAFMLGLWSAALGYPLWISFTFFTSNLVSITLYRSSATTLLLTPLLFFLPAPLGLALWHGPLAPATGALTTALSIAGLLVFLLMVSRMTYLRTLKLRDTREALRRSEQALHSTNEALQRKIDEIESLQARLSEQANRDPLTGLYNRRYLDSTLERELARCQREGQPLSLMLIDLDHFKQINDRWGHQAGDEVLRQLAAMLGTQARLADVACRYGGEEFLLLLPGMELAAAREKAEHWRRSFAQARIAFGEFSLQATLSIGIASYPGHGTSAQALIRSADQALYRAKTEGRNRVAVCEATSLPA